MAIRVSETSDKVRAAILSALRAGKIFAPYNGGRVTIEDLDSHATYENGRVWLAGMSFRVICGQGFCGSVCHEPIGHEGNHKAD